MTVALDLFAGHGWGVACRALGIEEYGVEIMPEAVAVRERNGMTTLYNDVWEGLAVEPDIVDAYENVPGPQFNDGKHWISDYDLLIASPPCQTFSMAGAGAGRKALDEVLSAIDARLYLDPAKLVAFGETHDPKTALVLAPLAHIARDTPMYVVLEQVPPVLPVWERYAEEMRRWGYSVWTGNLQAEMYGVPQTRKRAILIARADGREAKAPTPTHSRYYSRDPQRLDPGVAPWVSMAEALGWGMTERPFVTAGNAVGRAEGIGGSGGKAAVQREQERGAWIGNQKPYKTAGREDDYQTRSADEPIPTLTAGSRSAKVMRSNYSSGGPKGATAAERGRTMRGEDQPSVAMTGKPGHWIEGRGELEQVRTGMGKGMIERHGPRPARDVADPAFTVMAGTGGNSQPGFGVRPSPTVTGGGAATGGAEVFGRHGREIVEEMTDAPARATRVTIAEAATLQSYPADFRWDAEVADPRTGRTKPITKTNTFLQIGNAVPPRLAEAILREVLSDETRDR